MALVAVNNVVGYVVVVHARVEGLQKKTDDSIARTYASAILVGYRTNGYHRQNTEQSANAVLVFQVPRHHMCRRALNVPEIRQFHHLV